MDAEFRKLLAICAELSNQHPDITYIGGIAVYLHAVNGGEAEIAEATHDADFYVSMAEMSELRDVEDVTPNRRLNRHQIIRSGFEFDIYTERLSALIVPYDAVRAHAVRYGTIAVACQEHLLALKLEAFRDRRGSAKGDKDVRDIARLCLTMKKSRDRPFDPALVAAYLTDEHVSLLRDAAKSPEITALAGGNAKTAKDMRAQINRIVDMIAVATSNDGRPKKRPTP